MDFTTQYCPTRRDIEEHCWVLVTRFSSMTSALIRTIGGDRQAFLGLRCDCLDTRVELTDARNQLAAHRHAHGC